MTVPGRMTTGACPRQFWAARRTAAGRDLGELPGDAHGRRRGVDVAAAERDQLAPAKAAEAREQDHGAVAGAAGVGERVDLGDGEHWPFW